LALENILCEMEHWVDMILKFPNKIASMMVEMMMQDDIFLNKMMSMNLLHLIL